MYLLSISNRSVRIVDYAMSLIAWGIPIEKNANFNVKKQLLFIIFSLE